MSLYKLTLPARYPPPKYPLAYNNTARGSFHHRRTSCTALAYASVCVCARTHDNYDKYTAIITIARLKIPAQIYVCVWCVYIGQFAPYITRLRARAMLQGPPPEKFLTRGRGSLSFSPSLLRVFLSLPPVSASERPSEPLTLFSLYGSLTYIILFLSFTRINSRERVYR